MFQGTFCSRAIWWARLRITTARAALSGCFGSAGTGSRPGSAGTRLRMDPEDFGEVVGNLLDNARMWARGTVAVSAVPSGPGLMRLAVDDDGPGIAPEQREVLRGRGESGTKPGEGSGLGLAIVGDVLALYGTSLEIADSPLGGCRMAFTVPGWTGG